jgi:hypothetical protein
LNRKFDPKAETPQDQDVAKAATPKRIFQESHFLEIPGKIRRMIYEAALIKPSPIDLWPHTFVENPENDLSFAERIAKAYEEHVPPVVRYWDQPEPPYVPTFRQQHDLLYVRKEMATGLLATCKQMRRETTPIFWCENTFRFSGDLDWEGIRRFLQSIGPDTIGRLRRLEVFVPLNYKYCTYEFDHEEPGSWNWGNYREAKNAPKMHMSRLGKGSRDVRENVEIVASLLVEAKATLDISLVLPRGFVLRTIWWNPVTYFPDGLIFKRPFLKVSFVIELGAHVNGADLAETFTSCGINLVCMPGSFWWQTGDMSEEEAKVTVLKRHENRYDDFELLNGLQELMNEEKDGFGDPAMGGRVNKSPGPKKVARALNGFGKSQSPNLPNSWSQLCLNLMSIRELPHNGFFEVLTLHQSRRL